MSQGRKTQLRILLTEENRSELESWQRSTSISAGLARRARVVLLLATGTSVSQTARVVGIERRHVYKWARRFLDDGLNGLWDRPRGRTPSQSRERTTGLEARRHIGLSVNHAEGQALTESKRVAQKEDFCDRTESTASCQEEASLAPRLEEHVT